MKKYIVVCLALYPLLTMNLFAESIFMQATPAQLSAVPKITTSRDCVLNINGIRNAEFKEQVPSARFIPELEAILKAKGYKLRDVDYEIKLGLGGDVLESERGPGSGSDSWSKGDLVADFSLHIAKRGAYVSLSEMDSGKKIHEGIALRDYCEVFFTMGAAGEASESHLETLANLRLTKRSFFGESVACAKVLKQLEVVLPACKML